MFHIALPVADLNKTIIFYRDVLNATMGRSASYWADFNFYNNQITLMESDQFVLESPSLNREGIPAKHFGVVLPLDEWKRERHRIEKSDTPFLTEPKVVFPGLIGEQHSFFIQDPNGYAIEYKGFENLDNVFKENS